MEEKRIEEEFAALPFGSQHRIPLTSTIIYHFRWKINNLKLMLYDLDQLRKLHHIENAQLLYEIVKDETSLLCAVLAKIITEKREAINKITEG